MPSLPTASEVPPDAPGHGDRTYTFLFTDIERSTGLWAEDPAGMRAAVEEHDRELRALFAGHGGHVFRALGDAFYVAFGSASDALRAALAAQQTLAAIGARRPDLPEVRVRMAVHTGEAQARDGDYFGLALSHAARLRDAGHGGQVLVSAVASRLAGEGMPTGASLRDLGPHSLRDFPTPEPVFLLAHPDLPSDFPPLRTGTSTPHNLPRQLTSFVGREAEIADVRRLLSTAALVTLTGAGGCGKTRLSLEAASSLLGDFPGGVWFADLSAVRDEGLIEQTVAAALGVRPPPGRTHGEGLRDRLRAGPSLVILDNCEHLVDGCALFAETLLRDCPDLRVLATSREALGVPGETVTAVPTLRLPEKGRGAAEISVRRLMQSESARLFVDRARAAAPNFRLEAKDAPYVAAVCRQLDGIPLALEIAASWAGVLRPRQIAERIEDRFKLLRAGGSRTALPRQKTLRGAIEWSYDLLTEGERALLRRLSIFCGGWTLDAAEAVCGLPDDEDDVLTRLFLLVRKSLVLAEPHPADGTRYRLLDTIAQFAREALDAAGETEPIERRHQAYFLGLTETAEPKLASGEQKEWLDRLEREHDNLRGALAVGGANCDVRLRLAYALHRFWVTRGHVEEGKRHLDELLASTNGVGEEVSSELYCRAANAAGVLSLTSGDYDAARLRFEQVLASSRSRGDSTGVATALVNLGIIAHHLGDLDMAAARYKDSAALLRDAGDLPKLAMVLSNLGAAAEECGHLSEAEACQTEALSIQKRLGDKLRLANTLHNLGVIALKRGDTTAAHTRFFQCLHIRHQLADRTGLLDSITTLASLAVEERRFVEASWLMGAVESGCQELGAVIEPRLRGELEDDTHVTRERLGEVAFEEERLAGYGVGLMGAVEELIRKKADTAEFADF
jgi:predicted ATPase/class 3 adenylate cyclase/Tfp pilus assembly protein PilF